MKKHILHVKIDNRVRQQLEEFKRELGVRSISCLVKKLLEYSKPELALRYFEDEEQGCQYALVNEDLSLDRVSLHIYLEEEEYRWLKQNHRDLNYFSIAQIVRGMIDFGIGLLMQGVAEANRRWQEIARAWEKKQREVHGKMRKVLQLFSPHQLQPQNLGWVTIYNREFSALRKIFIKC